MSKAKYWPIDQNLWVWKQVDSHYENYWQKSYFNPTGENQVD